MWGLRLWVLGYGRTKQMFETGVKNDIGQMQCFLSMDHIS